MPELIIPNWPDLPGISAVSSCRLGGVSEGLHESLNLGDHVGDDKDAVWQNRQRFAQLAQMPAAPVWLNQVHGTQVLCLSPQTAFPPSGTVTADAAYSNMAGRVCTVMTADCLPLLVRSEAADEVAAIHAGWRGLLAGVIEQTLQCFSAKPQQLQVWLGPAIGPSAFAVGSEVQQAFVARAAVNHSAFTLDAQGQWRADLYQLARLVLMQAGVEQVYGGDYCTYTDNKRFFSYRRDGQTGRMASAIWIS
ncbi:peptidoglycan editing factor PgeF [Arsukibacterium sp.]|uniref:peptidoglycan editing factor PgeF n=1 Tax=Arsukibacterium sp. TaxID=1977258 RepID=UPI002FDB7885